LSSVLQSASFPATRTDALARLTAFVPHAGGTYAKTRNFDLGPEARDNVSLLSPYLRHRLITEDEVVRAVLAQHSLASAEKFIQEVVWRAYWKGWLEFRPAVWDRYLVSLDQARAGLKNKAVLTKQVADAEAGRTGIACFDAWAHELAAIGYLHNHARMWFASIWIFTLRLPWALGADFFLRHLLDGDAASNTLSWRWVAGLHTKGKSYLARPDNIDTFTRGRFGPTAPLASAAITFEPETDVIAGRLGPVDRLGITCPCALLITEDDLTPEFWAIPRANVRSVTVLDTATAYPGVAGRVVNFKRGAAADCARRIEAAFGQEPALPSGRPRAAGDARNAGWPRAQRGAACHSRSKTLGSGSARDPTALG
jgi:deoxyribodipyrimidine photo-lyase